MAIFNSYVSLLEVDRIWNVQKDSHFSEDSLKCPYFVYACPMQTNVWRAGFVLHSCTRFLSYLVAEKTSPWNPHDIPWKFQLLPPSMIFQWGIYIYVYIYIYKVCTYVYCIHVYTPSGCLTQLCKVAHFTWLTYETMANFHSWWIARWYIYIYIHIP